MHKFILILACGLTMTGAAHGQTLISPSDAYAMASAGDALLVDVRERSELMATGIVEGALWLPTSSIDRRDETFEAFVREHDSDQPMIFYCRTGRRPGLAAQAFADLGYATYNAGGFQEFIDAGLPVIPFTDL